MRINKKKMRIVIVIVAFISLAGIYKYTMHQPYRIDPRALADKPSRQATPVTQEQLQQLSNALESGKEEMFRKAAAVPESQELNIEEIKQIAKLGIVFDVSTFSDNGDGTAKIAAHSSNLDSSSNSFWSVILINDNGSWKLSTTNQQ